MRAGLILCFLCLPLDAQSPAPSENAGGARVEGRVTSVTGDPLRKATVRLQGTQPGAPVNGQVLPINYSSSSDTDGNFIFEDVDPGRYFLSAERTGFLHANYGTAPRTSQALNISVGQQLTGLVIKLTPQAVVGGKVTDEDGDPLPGINLQTNIVSWNEGRRQVQIGNSIMTMADGTFLIGGLSAGRYYLSAIDFRSGATGFQDRPGRKGPVEGYVTTYYPGAIDFTTAVPIELTPGIEVRGLEIRMRKVRLFRVAGRATHAAGLSTQGGRLMLVPANTFFLPPNTSLTATIRDDEGHFEFPRVLPGSYILQTPPNSIIRYSRDALPVPILGRALVNVGSEDIDNAAITLGPGAELSGTFLLDGVGPMTAAVRNARGLGAARMNIQIVAAEGLNQGVNPGIAKDDGTFQIKNIQPDRYRLSVNGIPAESYVKAVRFGGQDALHSVLDLTSGPGGNLEVVLALGAADVSGTVRNENGDAVPDAGLSIWSTDDRPSLLVDLFPNLRAGSGGAFKIPGLAPGEYRVLAWEQVDGGLQHDPELRKKFEAQAAKVKLDVNSHENIELKVIPRAEMEVEAAKIR
jgi:hypothetical protein